MHAAEAVQHARTALAEADERARAGFTEQATALVQVADGWTRLAATLAEHPVAQHVHNTTKGPSEEALRRAGRFGSWATDGRPV